MFKKIRDLLLPAECSVCGGNTGSSVMDGVCPDCLKNIEIINADGCRFCGRPVPDSDDVCRRCLRLEVFTDGIYTAAYYKEGIRDIIKDFKYSGKRYLGKYLGELIFGLYREFLENSDIDKIICLPMHRAKKQERGYNQAEILAGYLSKKTGIKKSGNYLKRVKKTVPQYNLSRHDRLENLSGAFKASKKAYGKHIIMIDDVATTGATIQNAARCLKNTGALRIYALVVAHGK
ncbi:MAG: ComF family protein [Elusimicrobia bacterium]|jgi:ComF family protein|nr:ComF family protein [Elusimicrobiota bacterium]